MELFRNHKFSKRRTEEDKHLDFGDDEATSNGPTKSHTRVDVVPSNARPAGAQKRASEPTISTIPAQTSDVPLSSGSRLFQRSESLAGSEYPRTVSQIKRSLSPANTTSIIDPLGLTLIHSAPEPLLDLIFIHGLGGTSRGTWSWEHDPRNFWPLWLGEDAELSRSRIFTFGYFANLTDVQSSFNILDFSKELLFRMKTFSSGLQVDNSPIGKFPIIFVVHSMGGLVAKKAYIIGKPDQQYADIVARIFAMVFLATPHKGSCSAQTLNNILKAVPGCSAKNYVAELDSNSSSLQDINEQFRNICGDLELVSFYETLKTSLASGVKKIIVEKDSAILGYPNETSSALVADHHGMSKFRDLLDANYIDVRNILRLMNKLGGKDGPRQTLTDLRQISYTAESSATPMPDEASIAKRLTNILGISKNLEDDLEYLLGRTMQGSCQWLLQRQAIRDWAGDSPNTTGALWLTGSPGSGKSTLASFIISMLSNGPFSGNCQYHFFVAGNQTKRTLSYMLRNIAMQVALWHDVFCTKLLEFHDKTNMTFGQQKFVVIWEKIFEGILFRIPFQGPLFWVFDGLDEAETPTELIRHLSKIRSASKINILLISRATKDLVQGIDEYLPVAIHEVISVRDTENDIRDYVRGLILKILPSDHAQEEIIQQILKKASGSFLWVKLALDRIRNNWHTESDIRVALTEIPEGMEPLYERMIEIIHNQPRKTREMATRILTWAACSFRPLEIGELQVGLVPEFVNFVNLHSTVKEVCGDFVVIDKSKICLIHETARQFLLQKTSDLKIKIIAHEGHKHIAIVCMNFLSDVSKWRRVFATIQVHQQARPTLGGAAAFDSHPFLFYALSFWAYHVSLASLTSDDLLEAVLSFLENYCLLWINGVALSRNLRILTRAAQYLKTYVKKRAHKVSEQAPLSLIMKRDNELRQWATDLIRVVGRFGNNIVENPSSVHKHVVPFCPKDSIMSRSLDHVGHSTFSVTGLSSKNWDDCMARLTMGNEQTASKILCKDTFFITLIGSDGTLVIWHSETCEEARRITHGEWVSLMFSSKRSSLVATAGFKTTKIWDITTGQELHSLPKETHIRTKAIAFGPKDEEVIIGYDDCSIRCFDLATEQEKWQFLAKDPTPTDYNIARCVSFSLDLTQVAFVFRGRPVFVWTIQQDSSIFTPPQRCTCAEDKFRPEGDALNNPEQILWQLDSNHLLILYEDTKVIDWNIADDEQLEYNHLGARVMELSADGNLLLTSDNNGTLSVWMIPKYRLTYQLKCDELVTDLAFSSDTTRFYDIRGSFCNVWEPDALFRPDGFDQDEMSSAYETIESEPVLSKDENDKVSVTALVCDHSDRFFCCGKENGTVIMYDILDGSKVRKLLSHSSTSSVIRLSWSASEKYFASADDSGKIIVKRLEPPTNSAPRKWAVFAVLELRVNEAVEQFLFSTREEYLLIASTSTACVIKLKSKKEICRIQRPSQKSGIWINHLTKPETLINMGGCEEHEYEWETLNPIDSSPISPLSATLATFSFGGAFDFIHRSVQVRGHWIVLEMLASTGNESSHFQHRHIDVVDLQHGARGLPVSTQSSSRRKRIDGLAKHVNRLIGCFRDRVVFLDHQFWLCTWELGRSYTQHKRHFFLPKDWLNPMTLRLIILNEQGTLLCPKNGEVAIVKSGLRL